ncbi:hypothetical protein CBS147353_11754 [Aspergillus niger]|nr:hypothetical protein CBS147353_11754 [Aspergillus niger]
MAVATRPSAGGLALYVYIINSNMENMAYCNSDGDFLITPQLSILDVQTVMGKLFVQPGEICVKMECALGSIWPKEAPWPLGGHGFASLSDSLHPIAHIDEDLHVPFTIVVKNTGRGVAIKQDHSPVDVVALHGNYVPYKFRRIP